jgi:hypothetical protein
VLDLHARAVVSWSMEDHMRAALVTQALSMALCQHQPAAGLITCIPTAAASMAPTAIGGS